MVGDDAIADSKRHWNIERRLKAMRGKSINKVGDVSVYSHSVLL